MEFIYSIFDTYLHVIQSFYSVFFSTKSTIDTISSFTAFLPLIYISMTPIMIYASGEEDESNTYKIILTIIFAAMLAGLIYFFRSFIENELTGKWIFWTWIFGIFSALSYNYETGLISSGIKKSNRD